MLETIVQGVLLGGLYTLFALGQSLMFGVMRLTNTAQGDFIILGAFAVIAGVSLTGDVAPWLVALAVLPVAFGFGYALQRYVLNGTLGKDPLPSLVVTFGLSIVIQNLLLELFSADPRAIETGGLNTQGIALGEAMSLGVLPLVVLAIAVIATGALQWLFAIQPQQTERGHAQRLSINAAADPAVGGALWRLRDGLQAAAPGPAGTANLLLGMQDALEALRPSSLAGMAPVPRTAATLAADLGSWAASGRIEAERVLGGATAQSSTFGAMRQQDGVDSDREMEALLALERAYASNAKVLQAVDEMLQTMLRLT